MRLQNGWMICAITPRDVADQEVIEISVECSGVAILDAHVIEVTEEQSHPE
jgi:hypothetical protein